YSGDGKLHRRRVRRRTSGHAIPGHADLMEGHAAAVCGPAPSSPRRKAICAGLRLCGQLRSNAGQDVRAQAEGLCRNWLCDRAGDDSTPYPGGGPPVAPDRSGLYARLMPPARRWRVLDEADFLGWCRRLALPLNLRWETGYPERFGNPGSDIDNAN